MKNLREWIARAFLGLRPLELFLIVVVVAMLAYAWDAYSSIEAVA